jgi:hypothetical protein
MSSRSREVAKAAAWFVLGALTMLLGFVLMIMHYGR